MDEITINLDDSPIISQPSSLLIGEQNPVVVQENFIGGQNATIQIGSVETLPAGSQAYVNNVGTETHAVLNFGLVTGNTGASGQDGSDGSDGSAATIQIGTVTTGLPNTNASVTNVGTPNAAILDFTIPQGVQGLQGIQGVAGVDGISPRAYVEQITGGARVVVEDSETTTTADIMDGTDGTDGTDGFSPVATVTPTASGATISITDAQGTTTANITNGVDGTDGTDGTSATVTVGSTTTGNAGTNASVTNSGTSSAAVLDFVIPRGADGTNGTDGSDGFSPIATVTSTSSGATISITDSQGTTTANITNGIDGTDGSDGVTPSITATASVDNTTGTPSVTVTKSGTDANPSFAFAFEHLKGENGTLSPTTVSISDFITPSSGVTITGNVYQFGKLIVCHLVVSSNTAFSSTAVNIGVLKPAYAPKNYINEYCAIGSTEWRIQGIAYMYVDANNFQVTDYNNTSRNYAKIMLTYVIN